jgi:DNA-binding NarL/FixJ family response regulator
MSSIDYAGPERRRPGPGGRGGEKTTILLVDDHALFRVGVRNILEKEPGFEIVGEADDTRSAFDLSVQLSPDIILMDLPAASRRLSGSSASCRRRGSSFSQSTRTRMPFSRR